MRAIAIDTRERIITTETPRFMCKPKVRTFKATKRLAGEFFQWVELPDHSMVPDRLSFQLDEWLEHPPQVTVGADHD